MGRPLLRLAATAAVATAVAWLLHLAGPLRSLEARTLDWRFLLRGPLTEVSGQVVLVLVENEEVLDYRSPLPRRHLAAVIDGLEATRLIGLDVLLDRPSFDAAADTLLRSAIARHGRVVGVSYLDGHRERPPHPFFRSALLDVGYATLPTDPEAPAVREGTLARDLPGGRALSLAGALLCHHLGVDTRRVRSGEVVRLPDGTPLFGPQPIDFAGPPTAVRRRRGLPGLMVCPSDLVAAGVYPEAFLRDRIAVVGTGLDDAADRFRTPFFAAGYGYETTLGAEIHAQFLEALASGRHLTRWSGSAGVASAAALASAASALVAWLRPAAGAAGATILLVAWWAAAVGLFAGGRQLAPLVFPSLATALAYGLATARYGLTEGRERRRTRLLFEKYLSPAVIGDLLEDRSYWELGGRSMEITVMFADLEGFTPIAERLSPQVLVRLMNRYLGEMSAILLEEGGTIDKYEGDLIMALFGAPVPMADHAGRGCRAALRMQERMVQLRREWTADGLPPMRVRIGLHSGTAVVGNMGSPVRFNYTAMGDTVNLASRLEGMNKQFGTSVMATEATRSLAGEAGLAFRSLGRCAVKGRSQGVAVYEVLAAPDGRG